MIKTYVKRPIAVQAVEWTGRNINEVMQFTGASASCHPGYGLIIHTLEGQLHASVGDFIIKGVQGEFYPCKPVIFALTYEEQD